MVEDAFSLLFGKKRRRRRTTTRRKSTKSKKKTAKPKRCGYTIKGVGSRARIVGVYKKSGKTGKYYYGGKTKVRKGKTCYSKKTLANRALKRKKAKSSKSGFGARRKSARKNCGGTLMKNKRRRRRRSSFGVGGSYVPLSSIMSPYPSSVSASPPWI